MSILKKYRVDLEAQEKGVKIKIEEANFYVCRMSSRSPIWRNALEELQRGTDLTEVQKEEKLRKLFVELLLKGWDNLINDDPELKLAPVGEEIPYSKENAEWLLINAPSLIDQLFVESTKESNYLFYKEEEDLKN